MAKVKNNPILSGLSGKLGGLVFKQKDGETIIAAAAEKRKTPPSEAQLEHLRKFERAKAYARTQIADPAAKAEYAARAHGSKTAYNVAVGDYMNPPHILTVDARTYHGRRGETLLIYVQDDFKVVRVQVKIYTADGTVVEEGEATELSGSGAWSWQATMDFPVAAGGMVEVTAYDKPGNHDRKEIVLAVTLSE